RIIDLRPGVYAVTFVLPGFSTVVRDRIDLPADFTAPVNVQLRVGELAETVTVSGQSPVVDVQTTTRQQVISQELIQALPTGRTREAFMATVPAVRTSQIDVGGATAPVDPAGAPSLKSVSEFPTRYQAWVPAKGQF